MRSVRLALAVCVLALLGVTSARAGQGGRGGPPRTPVPCPVDEMEKKLTDDLKLTDDQKKKVPDINTAFKAKLDEAEKKPEAAKAKEALDKARTAGDFSNMRDLMAKYTEAVGFNPRDEYKKALAGALTDKQIEKLYPPRPAGAGAGPGPGGGPPPAKGGGGGGTEKPPAPPAP